MERDFAIISYLLKHTPAAGSDNRLEDAVLKIHYRLLSAWFQATRSCMGDAATRALEGMSLVVAHFANAMGERRLAVAQRASR